MDAHIRQELQFQLEQQKSAFQPQLFQITENLFSKLSKLVNNVPLSSHPHLQHPPTRDQGPPLNGGPSNHQATESQQNLRWTPTSDNSSGACSGYSSSSISSNSTGAVPIGTEMEQQRKKRAQPQRIQKQQNPLPHKHHQVKHKNSLTTIAPNATASSSASIFSVPSAYHRVIIPNRGISMRGPNDPRPSPPIPPHRSATSLQNHQAARPPPPRMSLDQGPPAPLPSVGAIGNMQSGLMGSLSQQQQQPTRQPPQQASYDQSGNFLPSNSNNSILQNSTGTSSTTGLCVRPGCGRPAIESPQWDGEYCSEECCVRGCKQAFTGWTDAAKKRNASNSNEEMPNSTTADSSSSSHDTNNNSAALNSTTANSTTSTSSSSPSLSSQQDPYDGGNYYQQQQSQSQRPPFAQQGGDDRWGAPHQSNMAPMMDQNGIPPQDTNYRQKDMYRNQRLSNIRPLPLQQEHNPLSTERQQQQAQNQQESAARIHPKESIPQSNQQIPSSQQQASPSGGLFTLHLWNIPMTTRANDLVNFFAPLHLNENNVKIFTNDIGYQTGVARVEFNTSEEYQTALTYSGRFLVFKPILILPSDKVNNSSNMFYNNNSSGANSSNCSSTTSFSHNSSTVILNNNSSSSSNGGISMSPNDPLPPLQQMRTFNAPYNNENIETTEDVSVINLSDEDEDSDENSPQASSRHLPIPVSARVAASKFAPRRRHNRHFRCQVCEKEFASQFVLNRHMRIHSGERPFPCSQCNKSYRAKSALTDHMNTHIGVRFDCHRCGISYAFKRGLRKHVCNN